MRDLNECKAEIFRRSEKRIRERRKTEFKDKYLSPLLEEAKRLGMDRKEIALLIMEEEK